MRYRICKRSLDLACCLLGLIVFGPVMLVITVAIFIEEGRTVFFMQERIGQNFKKFKCYKFRTMTENRVTRTGKWLRETGLDELPQILNILKGEMSVVGPRPLSESDISRLNCENHAFRWRVKPGVTGLAQLNSGHGAKKSILMDRFYTLKCSISLDIRFILMSLCINMIGKKRFKKILSLRLKKSWL